MHICLHVCLPLACPLPSEQHMRYEDPICFHEMYEPSTKKLQIEFGQDSHFGNSMSLNHIQIFIGCKELVAV